MRFIKWSGLIDERPLLCFHSHLQWCEIIISAEPGEKHQNHHSRMRRVSKMWSEEGDEFDCASLTVRPKELRLCSFPFQTPTRRRNDQLREGQSTSSDSQQTVWSQPHWCQTGRRHRPRTTSNSQDTHITPSPFSIFPSLLRIYSSPKYVGTVYVCTKSLR